MLDTETKAAVEGALKAFNEYKGAVEEIKKTVDGHRVKLDTFDEAKFKKLADDVANGIEASQKANARAEAAEKRAQDAEKKALELETAFNRAPGAATSEEKSKEMRKKMNKLFNDFARTNGQMHFDEYLKQNHASDPEVKSLLVGADPQGGYLVMPEFGGVIVTQVFETSPMRQLADVVTIGQSDSYDVIVDQDQASGGWTGESSSRSATNTPTIGKIHIPAHELYAFPQATQKLLDDAMIDVEAWLAKKVADILSRTENTAFITGNGVSKPTGIMSYSSGTTLSSQQVEQVNSGDNANFTYDGLVNVQNALKEPYQANATWLYRRASNANIMQIKDGQGRPIFNMSYDKNVGLEPSLLGQPVRFAADVAAIAANALAAAYGDFKQAYQIVDRMGIRVLRDPYTSKPNVGFYTTKRTGGGVVNFEAYKIQKISA